ncbi:MAG: Rnf-Nqr domain containing protein, partial [Spirochaetales bacterium]
FLESLISGVAAGAGYIIAIGLLSILREQFVIEGVPRKMQGAPILFISAGLIAMAFFAIDTALITRLWE